jgi:uncharacterized repeat protein (TIGR03803 family)
MMPSGALTTLYNFSGPDGSAPCGMVLAPSGLLYGTTSGGGANNDGTVFSIKPSGELTTLHSFDGTDGIGACGLLAAGNDSFYGYTVGGGSTNGGTVFRITAGGKLTTLTNLAFRNTPNSLILGTDGNLYGAIAFGADYFGSIFQLTPSGALNFLYNFTGDGSVNFPANLLQATDGNLYGATGSDGDYYGVIFRLSLGLPPFVEALPNSGKVGATIRILGTSLMRPVSVTFNGTPAKITAVQPSEIIAIVPSGATTGPIRVAMSGSTLLSNAPFQVLP